jgi:hypothetical protein
MILRRTLLRNAFALAATRAFHNAGAQALQVHTLPSEHTAYPRGRKRDLLSRQFGAEALKTKLLPLDQYRPYPTITQRADWNALNPQTRQTLKAEGVANAAYRYQSMPASLLLEYSRTGNRSHFEQLRNSNLAALQAQTLAECVEDEGRYLASIADGLWAICEESFWGVPAHLYIQNKGLGLPDPRDPIVDLFAAQTAAAVATTVYLLGERLDTVSPVIRERVSVECERRIFVPLLSQNFAWMGLPGGKRRDDLPWDATPPGEVQPVNNWDAWICWNWLNTVLLVDSNADRRLAAVVKITRCLDDFIDSYPEDGGCEEGPSYWHVAAGAMFDALELLSSATSGWVDLWSNPLIKRMGDYIVEAHIAGDYFLNVGDAHPIIKIDVDQVFRYGKRVGSTAMVALSQSFLRDDYVPHTLPAIFAEATLRREPIHPQELAADVWLPDTVLMAARTQAGSTRGWYTACIASDNGKSHSHNDTGSIWLSIDGDPVLIDLGQEAYQKQSFDAHRYELFSTQSSYHNLPEIGGVEQGVGSAYRATKVAHRSNGANSSISFNMEQAYPAQAHLAALTRRLALDRSADTVELFDSFKLDGAAPVTWNFMTCRPVEITPGGLRLKPRQGEKSPAVIAVYDTASVRTVVEPLPLTNEGLVSSWGPLVYRIRITMSQRSEGQLQLRFRRS